MKAQLWIPGPTEVSSDVLQECARPMIGHRSKALTDTIAAIQPGLRSLFETEGSVLLLSSSASGAMEAAIRNLVPHRVLCCVNGAFSQRWYDIALACGKEAVKFEIPWGQGFQGPMLTKFLQANGPFDAVTLVHNETSTGAMSDLPTISCAMAAFEKILLLVDAVSSLGAVPVKFDAYQIDFCLAGVQKALALPPGLTVAAISSQALDRAKNATDRGWYFDLPALAEKMKENTTPATPAISLIFALKKQIEKVQAQGGWSRRYEEHRAMAETMDRWLEKNKLQLFPAPEFRSMTTSTVRAEGLDVASMISQMKERGYALSDGYGKLKGKTFRIGHMGDHTAEELKTLLRQLDEVLPSCRMR